MYLLVIIDWHSRAVVGWSLSNTMEASWVVETLDFAIQRHGKPAIINSDQGSQFTGADWITCLKEKDIKISMDGRGRYLDNIFIERLWRSLKQEAVYLHELTCGFTAKRVIGNWIDCYNSERPHSSLGYKTPNHAFLAGEKEKLAA